ncbi:MAG: hypothetical protein IPL39_14395 [Opitutaceae bacterium]|nr:hypothetical protein [Opitutaceae bacterium]
MAADQPGWPDRVRPLAAWSGASGDHDSHARRFSDLLPVDFDSNEEAPNSYAVEFTDSEAMHKEAKLTVDDQAGIVDAGRLIRKTIKADWLVTADQATRAGQEALRRSSAAGTWSASVRYGKAVTAAGTLLQPGDYVRVPISHPQASALVLQVIRITKVVYPADDTGSVDISGAFDPPAAPKLGVIESVAGPTQPGLVIPPISAARVLALPAMAAGEQPPMHVLASRPTGLATGINVYYDDSLDGDFPLVGRQTSYALPVSLVGSASAGATTVRIALLAGSDGSDFQRDSSYLRNWVGGATEGRNDELLLVLLQKEVDGTITGTANMQRVEVLSIAGAPTLVAGSTFDIPVLRGRRGTSALAFTSGSFPDVWTLYEGWIIPRYSLEGLSHGDFASMLTSGAVGHFRLGGYAGGTQYAPATAFDERDRRTSAALDLAEFAGQPDATTWAPALTAVIPSELYHGLSAAGVSIDNADNGLDATTAQDAIDELAARPVMPGGGAAGDVLRRTTDGYEWDPDDAGELTDSGAGQSLIATSPFGLRKLIAGTGIALSVTATAITISATTPPPSGGGAGPPGYSETAFAGIPSGSIESDSTGLGWSADATFFIAENLTAIDNFSGITTGTLTDWSGGTDWADAATFFIAENLTAIDNFAGIPTGTITAWAGGTSWAAAATTYVP